MKKLILLIGLFAGTLHATPVNILMITAVIIKMFTGVACSVPANNPINRISFFM